MIAEMQKNSNQNSIILAYFKISILQIKTTDY